MYVSQSMTRDVITIDKNAGILQARQLLDKHYIRHLPVIDQDNVLIGIVTDRDIRSAMPSAQLQQKDGRCDPDKVEALKIKDFMVTPKYTISPQDTIQDAMLLIQQARVGALPVVDSRKSLVGMLSVRDLLRAFVNVLGIGEPGVLVGIVVEEKVGQLKKIVDAITRMNISFGSVLVARHWEEGKRAVFVYLLTLNIAHVKKGLTEAGFELLDPMQWSLEHKP